MIKSITVVEGQSLYDICLQHYGSYDGLQDLIDLNFGIISSVDQLLPVGTELLIGEALDQDLVNYFLSEEIEIVSSLMPNDEVIDNGIFSKEFNEVFG